MVIVIITIVARRRRKSLASLMAQLLHGEAPENSSKFGGFSVFWSNFIVLKRFHFFINKKQTTSQFLWLVLSMSFLSPQGVVTLFDWPQKYYLRSFVVYHSASNFLKTTEGRDSHLTPALHSSDGAFFFLCISHVDFIGP